MPLHDAGVALCGGFPSPGGARPGECLRRVVRGGFHLPCSPPHTPLDKCPVRAPPTHNDYVGPFASFRSASPLCRLYPWTSLFLVFHS